MVREELENLLVELEYVERLRVECATVRKRGVRRVDTIVVHY